MFGKVTKKKGEPLAEAKRRTACDATLAIGERERERENAECVEAPKLCGYGGRGNRCRAATALMPAANELQSWQTLAIPF